MKSFEISGKAKGIYKEAKTYVQKNEKLNKLLDRAVKKLRHLEEDNEERDSFFGNVKVLIRMIRAHLSGDYRAFTPRTLLIFAFALLYFVIPTDLMPDFIPALGLVDDISLIYYVVKNFAEDIEHFLEWEGN